MLSREAILDHLPRLRRYARALTGDRFAADDLVQDTVERALSRWALLRPGSNPQVWLLTLMHNHFVNQKRSARERLEQTTVDGVLPELEVRSEQGDGLALQDLAAALYCLSEEHRSVLLLVAVEEMTYEECARILGVPIGTVMSRLTRARQKLARILAGEESLDVKGVKLEVVK